MAKKELMHHGVSLIPGIGEKQGSWYFPLKFLFTTICAAIIIVALGVLIDMLQLTGGIKIMILLLLIMIAVLYLAAAIIIFIEWWKNTKAIVDQEIAKKQILFLETYKKAAMLKPGAALYDETEWVHDIVEDLKAKTEKKPEKKK